MGEVYRARDTRLGRDIALKIVPERNRDREALARFQREAQAASALNHPHIIVVHDVGSAPMDGGDVAYYTMELLDGSNLRERYDRDPLPKIIGYFVQIADGLAKAHAAGIIHRDLKPENVMVTTDGYAKIVDFGLAKVTKADDGETNSPTVPNTASGAVVGTVSYMSPEQVEGRAVDGRSDIFAFGSMLYEALTGKRPFAARTSVDTMHAIAHREPDPLTSAGRFVPPDLQRIINRCLAKAPEDRYQSIKEAAIELRAVIRELESSTTRAAIRKRRAPTMTLAIVASVLVLAAIAGAIAMRRRASSAGIRSIAILPFANHSSSRDTDYLSEGITDDVINTLSQIPSLRVLARSTVIRYKGKVVDPTMAGKDLAVDALVIGELTARQPLINVKVEMVRTSDGAQLWGDQYNRNASNLLEIEQELSRDISDRLRLHLNAHEQTTLDRKPTQNPRAYELYLKGLYYWNRRPTGSAKAAGYFEAAVGEDPQYALAHAGIALIYATLGAWESAQMPPDIAFPKSKAAAEEALRLDPDLPEAWAALGFEQLHYERDFVAAERSLRKAIELRPLYGTAHHWLSHLLIATGHIAESLQESQKAIECEPDDQVILNHLAWHYIYSRQPQLAIARSRKLVDFGGPFWPWYFLGIASQEVGDFPGAIDALRKARDSSGGASFPAAALGCALGRSGQKEEARAVLAALRAMPGDKYVSPFDYAIVFIGLGDYDNAIEQLKVAVATHSSWCVYFRAEPRLDPVRNDPRFKALMQEIDAKAH